MDSKDLMKLYRKGNAEQYSFLVIDITLPSKNALNCQKNYKKRVAAKISTLSSGKIVRYEHQTDYEILPLKQHRIIKKANLIIHRSGKHWKNK